MLRLAHHRDSRVVGDVEPLVAIDGPGIGRIHALEQRRVKRRDSCPQAKRAIHMDPGTGRPFVLLRRFVSAFPISLRVPPQSGQGLDPIEEGLRVELVSVDEEQPVILL